LVLTIIQVLNQVKAAAEKYGRGFIVEWDVSGADSSQGSVASLLLSDYNAKIKQFTSSPAYIHQDGKPVVMVFGIGFQGMKTSAADSVNIANQLKNAGLYVGFGVPEQWAGDVNGNTGYVQAFKAADFISPWTVGGYSAAGYQGFHNSVQVPDSQYVITRLPCSSRLTANKQLETDSFSLSARSMLPSSSPALRPTTSMAAPIRPLLTTFLDTTALFCPLKPMP
jgi:hypothetical protein